MRISDLILEKLTDRLLRVLLFDCVLPLIQEGESLGQVSCTACVKLGVERTLMSFFSYIPCFFGLVILVRVVMFWDLFEFFDDFWSCGQIAPSSESCAIVVVVYALLLCAPSKQFDIPFVSK